jgi:hypothetical protein
MCEGVKKCVARPSQRERKADQKEPADREDKIKGCAAECQVLGND